MKDFVIMITAAEPGLGWKQDGFADAYVIATRNAVRDSLAMNTLAIVIRAYMAYTGVKNPAIMTATEWVEKLKNEGKDYKWASSLPTSPKAFSQELFRLAPQLEQVGITIEKVRDAYTRRIKITNLKRETEDNTIVKIDELPDLELAGRDEEAEDCERSPLDEEIARAKAEADEEEAALVKKPTIIKKPQT